MGLDRCVLTIGHSNHTLEFLLALLDEYGVEVIADVRSHPYSEYAPQFDIDALAKALCAAGSSASI